MEKFKNSIFIDYIFIVIGCTLMGIALNSFLEPKELVIGGATGIAVIVSHVSKQFFNFEIPMWLTNIVINIPLFIIAVKTFGIKFIKRTLFSTLFLSFALVYTSYIPYIEIDYLLASVFGGVLTGAGLGLIFKAFATTGGSDLAATIIHKYQRQYSVAKIMFVLDVIIISMGFFVFGINATMYAIIAVFIISKVIDAVLEGLDFAKAVFIISRKSNEIADVIFKELDRGVTSLYGKGMYSGEDTNVLLCVVGKKEISKLKDLVEIVDTSAFMVIADVREVLGEGFSDIQAHK